MATITITLSEFELQTALTQYVQKTHKVSGYEVSTSHLSVKDKLGNETQSGLVFGAVVTLVPEKHYGTDDR